MYLVVGEKLTLIEPSQQGIPFDEIFGHFVLGFFRTTKKLRTIAEIMMILMLLTLVHSKSRVFFGCLNYTKSQILTKLTPFLSIRDLLGNRKHRKNIFLFFFIQF